MQQACEFNNLTKFSVDEEKLLKTVETVLQEEKGEANYSVSLAFVDGEKMRELNRIHRGKDYITDVLSFFYNEGGVLGEVVVCPEKVEEDAQEKKISFEERCLVVTVHGVLHLLGYTHEDDLSENKMEEKTKLYLKKSQ